MRRHDQDDIAPGFVTDEFWWPDEIKGPWFVRLRFREVAGRMECVALSIEEYESLLEDEIPDSRAGAIIKAELIHRLPVGAWMRNARRVLAAKALGSGVLRGLEGDLDGVLPEWERGPKFLSPEKRTGRPRAYADDHFRNVAGVYADAWNLGDPPTKAVAQHFHVSHSTAARWVRECRKRGALGPTEKRKAGGILPRDPKEDR